MITKPIVPLTTMIIFSVFCILIGSKSIRSLITTIILVSLLFLANLRILLPDGEANVLSDNLDVLFVIDTTLSMAAEDMKDNETRLSALKKDCEHIITELGGSKYSIVTFDNISQTRIPYTYDVNIAIESINALIPINNVYATGSGLGIPIPDMKKQLESAASKDDDRVNIVFYISDGEITNSQSLGNFTTLKELINGGAVLGYGTTTGGYMKASYGYTSGSYITTANGQRAISKIDENNLKTIANQMGIDYINMSDQSKIDGKLAEIKKGIVLEDEEEMTKAYKETYYYFISAFIVVLSIDILLLKRSF